MFKHGAIIGNDVTIRYPGTGTMVFECQQCGECCHHMGQVHTIKEIRGEFAFLVNNEYTGEKTEVMVDLDKRDLFFDKRIFLDQPEACPFLRNYPGDHKAYCTVHLTRPEICRDYGCWRVLILNSQGTRAGRIMYRRAFFSDDAILTRLWNECIDPLEEPGDELWDEKITSILINAGYSVRK
ncbi:MAG: YkgJ family cysteine cluster protein [Methanoregula sp.]|nr:YkgJ family cysteine cluster protein [Methanoregula sp.]